MGNVAIDLKELSGVTPGDDNLKDAVVWFYPYRPYNDGSALVTTDKLVVDTVDGVGSTFLPETPAGNGVYVEIRRVRLPESSRKFIVAIPAGDVNLFDLPHLDPTTLDPDAPLDPAWVDSLNTAVPLGGTTGQVLAKASDADHDDVWVDQTGGGGGGAVSSVNTKTGAVVLTQDDIGDGTTAKQYSATDKTKLSGIAAGATANSSDATLLARANHTGTESADVLTDGTTNKAFLATERTKLSGIATGATANQSDATTNAAIAAAQAASQPLDSDLTTIAGLTATTNNMLQAVGSAWASRTPAQVKTALAIAAAELTDFNTAADARVTAGTTAFGRDDIAPRILGSKVGLLYNGTDETTTFNTALATLSTYGAGTLELEGLVRVDGQIVTPTTISGTQVRQAPIRVTGLSASNGPGSTFTTLPYPTAPGLDLRYKGRTDTGCTTTLGSVIVGNASALAADRGNIITGPGIPDNTWILAADVGVGYTISNRARATATATLTNFGGRIQSLGYGTLEIDHLQLCNNGGTASSAPFGISTATKIEAHDNVFIGHSTKSGATCDEDIWICGGPGQGTNLTTALVSGNSYTTLAVKALPVAIIAGASLTLTGTAGQSQTVVAPSGAASGATSITVTSFTANASFPLRSSVYIGGWQAQADTGAWSTASGMFQGYASHIRGNQFYRCRRIAAGGFATGVHIDDNAWMHDCGSNLATPFSTLTTGLTAASIYTTLAVSALSRAALTGDIIQIGIGDTSQEVVLAADAAAAATSLTVTSFTANATYTIGTKVFNSTTSIGSMVSSFAIPGSANTINVTDNRMGWSGGYSHAVQLSGLTQGSLVAHNDFQDTASGSVPTTTSLGGVRCERGSQYNTLIPGLGGSGVVTVDDWSAVTGPIDASQTVVDSQQARQSKFPQGLRLGSSLFVKDPTVAAFTIYGSDGTGLLDISGSGRVTSFNGPLTVRGNTVSGSTLTIGDSSVAAAAILTINATSGQTGQIQYKRAGANSWLLYDANSTSLFLRDSVNAKMHLTMFPGAGAGGGDTDINSTLHVHGQTTLVASTTAAPSLNVPHGAAPSSPTNGDIWTTTAGLFVRINGATVGPLT